MATDNCQRIVIARKINGKLLKLLLLQTKTLNKNNKIVADGLCTAKYEIVSRTGEIERERERRALVEAGVKNECAVYSATGTT